MYEYVVIWWYLQSIDSCSSCTCLGENNCQMFLQFLLEKKIWKYFSMNGANVSDALFTHARMRVFLSNYKMAACNQLCSSQCMFQLVWLYIDFFFCDVEVLRVCVSVIPQPHNMCGCRCMPAWRLLCRRASLAASCGRAFVHDCRLMYLCVGIVNQWQRNAVCLFF